MSEKNNVTPSKVYGWGIRHVQAVLIFLCFTSAYWVKTSMSVAVIAMTDTTQISDGIQIYNWDKETQDYILSSFFVGYTVMQIPGGQLAHRLGGKYLICIALVVNGVFSIIIPTAAGIYDWKAVIACRAIQGLFQGMVIPSIHTLLGKWAPVNERNRFGMFVYSGDNVGTILGMFTSGLFTSTTIGWPLIFYGVGGVCMACGILLFIFGAEKPSQHKYISAEEREYIEGSLIQKKRRKNRKTPWLSIVKSVPFAALILAHIGGLWAFLLLITETPSYLKMALGIDVESSGMLSALPYLCAWFTVMFSSYIADRLVNKNIFTVTTVRKICQGVGTYGPAILMLLITLLNEHQKVLAVFMIVVIVCMDAINTLGYLLNHIDLSPNYAGVLVSISTCIAVGISNFAPIMAGYILRDSTDIKQWRMIFFIAAGVYFVTSTIFLIFGSGERQPWDSEEIDEPNENIEIQRQQTGNKENRIASTE